MRVEHLYIVTFERLGRASIPPQVTFNAESADSLAKQIHRFCQERLVSKWFDVNLDIEVGTGSVEYGRFGRFTIEDRGAFVQ